MSDGGSQSKTQAEHKSAAFTHVRRLLGLFVGVAILVVLYRRLDVKKDELGGAMTAAHGGLLALALALFVPQVAVMAWRWQLIGSAVRPLSFWESCRMVLAGSSLNVLLPSKLGDMCKGLMLGSPGRRDADADTALDVTARAGKPGPTLALFGSRPHGHQVQYAVRVALPAPGEGVARRVGDHVAARGDVHD